MGVSGIGNYIREQKVDSTFFKVVSFIPVVNVIVHLWKRSFLFQELKDINFDPKETVAKTHREKYNLAANKIIEIEKFRDSLFGKGSVGAVAIAITAFVIGKFSYIASLVVGAFPVFTLIVTLHLVTKDDSLVKNHRNCRPNDYILKDYVLV